ncbi:hypothetical protein Glove_21g81 [Diversispora epigaea]|uniref:Uncharacterized protein n=1 Tax=Diversispora epigaea TaxID=1348612 RepID=A0A397JPH7_9GLOM|nr:hypothetical protein Glove_21g81 [Diversispora epigaea]
MTQNNVKTWVKHLSVFVKELNNEYQVPPIEVAFRSDLNSSIVLPVRHKYDEMVRIVASPHYVSHLKNVQFNFIITLHKMR